MREPRPAGFVRLWLRALGSPRRPYRPGSAGKGAGPAPGCRLPGAPGPRGRIPPGGDEMSKGRAPPPGLAPVLWLVLSRAGRGAYARPPQWRPPFPVTVVGDSVRKTERGGWLLLPPIQPLPQDDEALRRFQGQGPFVWFWEPGQVCVVLGRGTPEADVDLPACAAAGVPVYRRRGGGGAVVLAPGMLVVTGCWRPGVRRFPADWLIPIAEAIARGLQRLGVPASVQGFGDVCLGDRKVLGSSLYASRDCILYQGSLLVDPDLSLIPRYLPHPSREPAYRRGRPHLEFVTSLAAAGYRLARPQIEAALLAELQALG